uniref:Uncharacterized protein n=1 Tax=Arundo donax TaxID=35708 RepID=A0A0A9CS45_ARUDO
MSCKCRRHHHPLHHPFLHSLLTLHCFLQKTLHFQNLSKPRSALLHQHQLQFSHSDGKQEWSSFLCGGALSSLSSQA